MLVSTDPGDLVLDPTCGSGTTAYVAEQWGRRWITIGYVSRGAGPSAGSYHGLRGIRIYLLADSRAGQVKESEITGTQRFQAQAIRARTCFGMASCMSAYLTSPLKSIANNAEIDVIWEQWQAKLEPLREQLNQSLR